MLARTGKAPIAYEKNAGSRMAAVDGHHPFADYMGGVQPVV